jgi:hypothetical protein
MSTDAIDNLQNTKDPKEDPNFKKFFANFGVTTGIIIGFVVLGSIGLYMSKIAQSGILPTNPLFKPYTCDDNTEPVKSGDIEMNIVREFGVKGLGWMLGQSPISAYSQQATFDAKAFEKTFKGGYIKSLFDATQPLNQKPDWKVTNIALWRSDVLNQMVSSSFNIIQTVFGSVGSLNESVALFLFGLFGVSCLPFLMLFNLGNSFWKHFTSLAKVNFSLTNGLEFLKLRTREENGETNFDPPPPGLLSILGIVKQHKPDDVTFWEKLKFVLKWIFTTAGLACYFLVSMMLFSPVFVTVYTLFKPLLAKYRVKLNDTYSGKEGAGKSESKGLFSFIRDTFAYKRSYIIFLSIINLFMQTNTYLGTYYFAAVIIAVIFAIVYCNIFVSKKSSNDNTMIPMKNDNATGDDDDELDSDDDGDDCVDEKDQLKLIQEQINQILMGDGTNTTNCINTNQREIIELINKVIQVCDNVQNQDPSKPLTKKDLTDKTGFKQLDDDVNTLVKLYFSGGDLGRPLLVLDASDELQTQIKKLNAQLKYLRGYQKALESAYKNCNKSLDTFAGASGIAQIPAVDDQLQNNFLDLMTVVQQGEKTMYSIRPSILDIIDAYIIKQEKSNSDSNPNPGLDLKAGLTKNSLMSFKKDKANLLYMEKVMPLERTIKQISTNLLPGKDILLDLILPTIDNQLDDWITRIQLKINEYDNAINSEDIFKDILGVRKPSALGSSSSSSSKLSSGSSSSSSSSSSSGSGSSSKSKISSGDTSVIAGSGSSSSLSPSLSSSSVDSNSNNLNTSDGSIIHFMSATEGGGKRTKTRRVQDSGKTEYKIRFV